MVTKVAVSSLSFRVTRASSCLHQLPFGALRSPRCLTNTATHRQLLHLRHSRPFIRVSDIQLIIVLWFRCVSIECGLLVYILTAVCGCPGAVAVVDEVLWWPVGAAAHPQQWTQDEEPQQDEQEHPVSHEQPVLVVFPGNKARCKHRASIINIRRKAKFLKSYPNDATWPSMRLKPCNPNFCSIACSSHQQKKDLHHCPFAPVTDGFPSQGASDSESFTMPWGLHDCTQKCYIFTYNNTRTGIRSTARFWRNDGRHFEWCYLVHKLNTSHWQTGHFWIASTVHADVLTSLVARASARTMMANVSVSIRDLLSNTFSTLNTFSKHICGDEGIKYIP